MDNIKVLLRSKGLKATAQRVIVYNVMAGVCHAPVDEVVRRVHMVMPTITVASVYKILESFSECGLISKLFTDDNKLYYDITPSAHHHLYEIEGNRIEDYTDSELSELIANYLRSKNIEGFVPQNIRIQIVGTFNK